MLNDVVRRYSYWILDFLRGGTIRKYYNQTKKLIENKENNLLQLESILKYAKENVLYYSNIDNLKLENFPVLTKCDYMKNGDDLSSREYTDKNKLHHVSTSGSTGIPFEAFQDNIKRKRVIASLIYFHEKAGFKLGYKYVFLRAWTSSYSVSKLRKFTQNYIPIEVVGMDDKRCEELRNLLKKDKKIKVILGYASSLEVFVNYLYSKNDNYTMFNVKSILTGSDTLKPEIKEKLESMFNCSVCNRYSNEEQGMIGMTLPNNNNFILNTANYYFEILKLDSDLPAEPGEIGRLVITDLYNYAMPFIRYDTGDLVKSNDEAGNIKTLESLEGRTADLLEDTMGNPISSASINNYIHKVNGVEQYQIIQEGKINYKILIVKRNNEFDEKKCLLKMKECFGENAIIKIEFVDKIEVQKNGKYKMTIKSF